MAAIICAYGIGERNTARVVGIKPGLENIRIVVIKAMSEEKKKQMKSTNLTNILLV